METPHDRLSAVQAKIAAAAAKSGRSVSEIELLAVSKTHPPEAVLAIADEGQALFGESRVQEAKAKIPLLPSRLRWQFIGHLQKNKIRAALPFFELFHSVDSLDLAQQFARIADEEGQRPAVLLEVNVAGEASKFGFAPDRLEAQIESLLELSRLDIQGLMTLAPYATQPESARPFFARLRELRDHLQGTLGVGLPQLSMGMSGDYEVAIEEGATIVRVGSAIFGQRSGKSWAPGGNEDA